MKRMHGRIGMVAAAALLASAAACSNKSPAADPSLAADLKAATGGDVELAPQGNPGQVVVSPLEGGPESAPKKVVPQRVLKPSPRATTRVASQAEAAPAPAPEPTPVAPSPAATEPAQVQQAPATAPAASRPAPVRTQQRQSGTYKTEAEIFKQMPWIRP
jgi:hypothetical protein